MCFAFLFFMCGIAIIEGDSNQRVCTPLANFPQFVRGSPIQHSVYYLTFERLHALQCVLKCMNSSPCKSISFDLHSGQCRLYDTEKNSNETIITSVVTTDVAKWPKYLAGSCKSHSCPNNTICVERNFGGYFCEVMGCLSTPLMEPYLKRRQPCWQAGFKVKEACPEGFYPNVSVSCQVDGQWSTYECLLYPSNCSEVKKCNSAYEDGDYWTYYFDGSEYKWVKIYCRGMSWAKPVHYISLYFTTFASKSPYTYSDNATCNVTLNSDDVIKEKSQGFLHYQKLRIKVTPPAERIFALDTGDKVFSNKHGSLRIGDGLDCELQREYCPVLGEFQIDLRNTSFVVSNTTTWRKFSGDIGYIDNITWSSNNQIVQGRCGSDHEGMCGGCHVNGKFYVEINPQSRPDFSSAVLPECEHTTNISWW